MSEISFGDEDGDFEIPETMMMPTDSAARPTPVVEPIRTKGADGHTGIIAVDGDEYTILRPGKRYMDVKTPVTRKVCEENGICWQDTWIVGRRKANYDGATHGDPERYNEWDCLFLVMTDYTPYKSINLTCSNVISTTTNRAGGGPQEPTPNMANRIAIRFESEMIWVPPRPDSTVSKSKRKNHTANAAPAKKKARTISEAELTKSFCADMDDTPLTAGGLVTHGKSLLDWPERPEPADEPDAWGGIALPSGIVAASKKKKSRAGPSGTADGGKAATVIKDTTVAPMAGPKDAGTATPAISEDPFVGMTHRQAMRAMRKYLGGSSLMPVRQRSMFGLLMGICKRHVSEKKHAGGPTVFTSHTLTKLGLPPSKWTEHDMVIAIKKYGEDKQSRKALLSDWNSIQAAFNELFAPEYTADF